VREELLIWKALIGKTWILWFYSFVIVLVDALFWSIGILYAEELKEQYSIGELFLLVYMLPSTVMGFVLPAIVERLGKKKTAFITGGLGGLLLFIFAFVNNIYLLLGTMLLSSILTAIAYPALSATYEDYIKRLGLYGNDMVGLQQTSGSLAYIIGPIVFGAVAVVVGTHKTFAFAGMLLASTAVASLVVVPKKIKMPQKELNEVATIA
jgi:MFS family permease